MGRPDEPNGKASQHTHTPLHLHGSFYSVEPQRIRFPDAAYLSNGTLDGFCNPRRINAGGQSPPALSRDKMRELYESIKANGVIHAITLWGGDKVGSGADPVLLAGERRLRTILKLVADNALCKIDGGWKPAREAYQRLTCNIHYGISEEEAYALAFSENEHSESIGDASTISLVQQWLGRGWTPDKIMRVTGKSRTWLSDADRILALDPRILGPYFEGRINRNVALLLSEEPDVETAVSKMYQSIQDTIDRHTRMKLTLDRKAEYSQAAVDRAQIRLNIVRRTKPNSITQQELEQKVNEATEKAMAAKKASQSHRVRSIVVSTLDIKKSHPKPLTPAKFKRHYVNVAQELLNKGSPEKYYVDEKDLELVCRLWEGMQDGSTSLLAILQNHRKDSLKKP